MSSAAVGVVPFPGRQALARDVAERGLEISELIAQFQDRILSRQDDRLHVITTPAQTQVSDKEPATPPQADAAGTRRLIFFLALTWLLAIGLPVVETQFSVTEQAVMTNELATVGIALAVTWRAIDKRKQ